jgi:putative restriction endonuclease
MSRGKGSRRNDGVNAGGSFVLTSSELVVGDVYTRADLRTRYAITDKTVDTGIFRPAHHDSVWLFVTERKKAGSIQYIDRLDGNTLRWQSQASGRKDQLIIHHRGESELRRTGRGRVRISVREPAGLPSAGRT